jgi:hypothetical protein
MVGYKAQAGPRFDEDPRRTVTMSLNMSFNTAAKVGRLTFGRPCQSSTTEAQMTPIAARTARIIRIRRATRASWRAPFASHRAHRSSNDRGLVAPLANWFTATASRDSIMIVSPSKVAPDGSFSRSATFQRDAVPRRSYERAPSTA